MSLSRKRNFWAAALLCAATLFAYSSSFQAGFPGDNRYLTLDPRLRAVTGENLDLIASRTYWWPEAEAGLYRPLTTLTYLFNYTVLGNRTDPAGYHWVNNLLHATNVVLAFVLALRLMGGFWPPVFVAGLWALHPALTESVTNIIGRSDILAGTAILGGLLVYLKSTEAGARRVRWLAGLFLLTTIGVFSKENAVAIVAAIAAYEIVFWRERKQWRGFLWSCAATVPPILIMLVLRARAIASVQQGVFPFVDNPLMGADFWTARLTAVGVLAQYLRVLAFPVTLSNDYSYNQVPLATGSPADWAAWAVVAVAVAAGAFLCARNRTVFFLIGFACVTMMPTSNLIIRIGTIMAERFLYLPALTFCACLVMGLYELGRRLGKPALAPWVLGIVALAFCARTWNRSLDYQDELTLWTQAAEASPNSFKVHRALAVELARRDTTSTNIDKVISESDRALAILNPLPDALNTSIPYAEAGLYYRAKGDLTARKAPGGQPGPESMQAYQRSFALLQRGVAIDIVANRQFKEREAAAGKPAAQIGTFHNAVLYQQLALTEMRLGKMEEAIRHTRFTRLLSLDNIGIHRQLVEILRTAGQTREAAIAAIEGFLLTGSGSFVPLVGSFYMPQDRACVIQGAGTQESLNIHCPAVFPLVCEAAANTERLYNGVRRPDMARLMRDTMVRTGCPAGPLDAALQEKP